MSRYKLVALDMDGTLLTEEKTISEENRKWIHRAIDNGIPVMFATGRGVQSVEPYVEELKLKSPMISVNGGEVWEAPNVLRKRHEMKKEWIRDLLRIADEKGAWYWAYAVEGLFNKDRWVDDLEGLQWLKFGYYLENAEVLEEIRSQVEALGHFELTNSHVFNIEVNPKGVSKAEGLREVCRFLGIEMKDVIAMGDSLNDIKMIQAAGLGVAMGNAQDAVKEAADIVTVTNEEDGVARVIREYIFGEKE